MSAQRRRDDHAPSTSRRCWTPFGVDGAADVTVAQPDAAPAWPQQLVRTSDYLTHPVFHSHRSETAMLRYLRRLSDRDFALDRGMIPLGSCTMKLNATTEMEPITWPEFAGAAPVRAGSSRPRASAS